MPRILIVTGEASGDLHGANLAKALKELDPKVSILGIGGAALRAAGVELAPGVAPLDIMGLVGPSDLKALFQRVVGIRRILRQEPFDLVVLIDHPGLNFHFARIAKSTGRRVLYYIAPQLWAWRPGRMRWMQQRIDHVVVILPFERALYQRAGVPCTFVGHPLLDAVAPSYDQRDVRRRLGLEAPGCVIGLLPGSRTAEVRALLPVLLDAARRLMDEQPNAQFILAQASSIRDDLLQGILATASVKVQVYRDQANEVMAASDLLLVSSGTATLQAAVVGTPMILLYRTTWPTYWLARLVIRVKWIGLVNLVAGRQVVPELIQQEASAKRVAAEAARLLRDRTAYNEMKAALRAVRESLGSPGASRRAAEVVLSMCQT
ncbi:MAG: lipid-A-disaccharide synthase [Nitrospiraceae bacterium]